MNPSHPTYLSANLGTTTSRRALLALLLLAAAALLLLGCGDVQTDDAGADAGDAASGTRTDARERPPADRRDGSSTPPDETFRPSTDEREPDGGAPVTGSGESCSVADDCPAWGCACEDGAVIDAAACYNDGCALDEEVCGVACDQLGHGAWLGDAEPIGEPATCDSSDDGFVCGDGTCIPRDYLCDGYLDCADESDEDCETDPEPGCSGSEFTCADGSCIPGNYECDDTVDCADGSDEAPENPSCGGGSTVCSIDDFSCGDGSCIPGNYECDGTIDCSDASDEAPNNLSCDFDSGCESTEFTCANGGCIDGDFECDGRMDCADGSDEAPTNSWCF